MVAVVAALVPALPGRALAWTPEPTPLDLVMAVDESASLAPEDVRREIEAAATIAQSGLNPRTRVTVLGFGSDNGGGQKAVTQYCRPTVVGTAGQLQYLSDCVKKLHRRTEAEGNDTDHVAAVAEALRVLRSGSPGDSLKTIFVLTDGRTDVSRSPSYGPGDRNAEARRRLGDQLRVARREGVQTWALGFGPDVDQGSLNRFVEGGAQRACDQRAESRPRARRVVDSRQVARSLVEAYAAASCFRVSPPSDGVLRPGGTAELPLDIPGIASEATLTVAKGDPRVRVEFVAPDGRPAPASGTQYRSTFTRSGMDGTIEALRVTEPLNGRWRIRLTAPDGVSRLPVGATAMYQGVIRSSLVAEPPAVRTGERVTARLSLVTRAGHVQRPEELRELSFSVSATGKALGAERPVTMRDDGRAPDDSPGDGTYAGVFTAPDTPGQVTLTGTVAGAGLRSDGNPTTTVNVTSRPPEIQGTVTFPDGTTAHPGGAVQGTIRLHNATSRTVRGRLDLRAPPQAQAKLTPAATVDIPPGGSVHDFSVRFGARAVLGRAPITVRMTDASDPAKMYLTRQSAMSVEGPPGWLERHFWKILFGLALIALAVAVPWLRWRVRRRRSDVRCLRVSLRQDGGTPGNELRPSRDGWSDEFRFVIRGAGSPTPSLDSPRPDDKDVLVARRTRDGQITVSRSDGTEFQVSAGAESRPVTGGLRLVFRVEHGPASRTRTPPSRPETEPSESWWGDGPEPQPDPLITQPRTSGTADDHDWI